MDGDKRADAPCASNMSGELVACTTTQERIAIHMVWMDRIDIAPFPKRPMLVAFVDILIPST